MSDDGLLRTTTVKERWTQARCDRVLGTLVVNHYDTLLNLISNYEISIGPVASFDFHTLPSMQLRFLEVEAYAVCTVSHLRNQKSLYRPFFRRATTCISSSRARHAAATSRPRSLPDDDYAAIAGMGARSLENGIAAEPPRAVLKHGAPLRRIEQLASKMAQSHALLNALPRFRPHLADSEFRSRSEAENSQSAR